jgi:outer membrane protein
MKSFIAYSILILFFQPVVAQQAWTLQQCLETGMKNTPDFQLRQLDILSAETTHRSPLMEYLPQVSVNGQHSYSIGSTIDPATNTRVSSNIQSDNFSLSAGMDLINFNVFTVARRNKIAVLKAKADKEATAAEYSLSILENFYNIIYTQDLLKIQLTQFENAKFNLDRIEKEVEIGSRPKSDLYDMQVSYAQEDNAITTTTQLLYNQKLTLLQLMNVTNTTPDGIVLEHTLPTQFTGANFATLLENGYKNYPKIQSAQLAAEVARKEVTMKKNNNLPVLSAFYTYSSFYYLPLNQPGSPSVAPFFTQLDNNKNHYVGAQLSIPVFNGLRNHRDVQLARLEYDKRNIETEQEKIKLRQTIEQETAKHEQNLLLATKLEDTRAFAQKSFETTQSKFRSGIIEAITFSASKNQLLTAEYNLLKAKVTTEYTALKLQFLAFNTFTD